MNLLRVMLVALVASCGPGWDVPPEVAFRRGAAARLENCVQYNCYCNADIQAQCFADSREYCLANGYPKECGYGENEGSCGARCK